MQTYLPLVDRTPEDLQGNQRFVLNVFINGSRGNLGPFTAEKIASYAEMDLVDVAEAIDELVKKKLIFKEEWA